MTCSALATLSLHLRLFHSVTLFVGPGVHFQSFATSGYNLVHIIPLTLKAELSDPPDQASPETPSNMYFRAAIGAATLWSFAHAQLSALENYVDSVDLGFDFNPVKEAYWTSLPRHRRTPFSVSPDGTSAYLAYLDNSGSDVHVIEVDPTDFTAKGTPVTVSGGEEGMIL